MGTARWAAVVVAAMVVATTMVVGIGAGPAGAHVDLLSSCPASGELISDLPTIRFTFDSPLQVTADQPATIRVSRLDGGAATPLGGTGLVGANALIADTVGPLAPGEYVASYTVTSIDGDFNEGEVKFSYDNAAADATNCVIPEADDGGSSAVKQALLLGVPVVVVGAALVMFNRWAKARTSEPA